MKNIDFLPDIYRHRRTLRHTRLCWMAVGIVFALAISGAAGGQWFFRAALAVQLHAVEPQYALALSHQAEIAELEKAKQTTEELADLYLYLEYPWPTTQLLAAIAEAMPASIQLTDLQLLEQAASAAPPRGADSDTNHATAGSEKAAKPTAKSVLAALRSEHDRLQTILELSGEATNDREVHQYVDALSKSPLFASASLKGLESGGEDKRGLSRFHIRAVVHSGYGQPKAPAAKATRADVALSRAASPRAATSPGDSP